jgi:hypothetical protein
MRYEFFGIFLVVIVHLAGCSDCPKGDICVPVEDSDSGAKHDSPGATVTEFCQTPPAAGCTPCKSDFDCGTCAAAANAAACNEATGDCEVTQCTSDKECPAKQFCNAVVGVCLNYDDAYACSGIDCSDGPCPCNSVCNAATNQCD